MRSKNIFDRFATRFSHLTGHPLAFFLAMLVILAWAITGPIFHFSDTWQLIINTGTTIVTFLMVFLIQNTQYRDTEAMQIKLDELIRALKPARNVMLDIEELSEDEIDKIKNTYLHLASRARKKHRKKLRRPLQKLKKPMLRKSF